MDKQTLLINAFALLANTDGTEGRGIDRDVALFHNKADAILVNDDPRFYTKHGVMGTRRDSNFGVVERQFVIYGSVDEFFNVKMHQDKANALAKLSKDELAALKALGV